MIAILKPPNKYGPPIQPSPSSNYQKNGRHKVDLFEENTNANEVRKFLKVNLKTLQVNHLEVPYIILYLEAEDRIHNTNS